MSRKPTPDQEQQETANAGVDVPTPEGNAEGQSFADRVGQRERNVIPDPFGIASDTVARVRLFESRREHVMALKFGDGGPEDKPSQAVRDKLKEAGYHWIPTQRYWAHGVDRDSGRQTRIDAERLFQEVRQMIRHEKGAEAGQEVPF